MVKIRKKKKEKRKERMKERNSRRIHVSRATRLRQNGVRARRVKAHPILIIS